MSTLRQKIDDAVRAMRDHPPAWRSPQAHDEALVDAINLVAVRHAEAALGHAVPAVCETLRLNSHEERHNYIKAALAAAEG